MSRTSAADAESWEKVVLKLRAGLMPPAGRPRPDRAAHDGFAAWLERQLDRAAAANPNPGPHRAVPSSESRRVSERHPRSARPRRGRRLAAAGRRCERRVRQHRQRADDIADVDGSLPGRGAEGRRGWPSARRRRCRTSTISASPTTSRRTTTCPACRSARAAARAFATRSRCDGEYVDPGQARARPERRRCRPTPTRSSWR